MARKTTTAGAGTWQSRPKNAELPVPKPDGRRAAPQLGEAFHATDVRTRKAGRRAPPAMSGQSRPTPLPMKMLSVRAQNVLKELAVELTGEQPPGGAWSPSRELLLAVTAERLAVARNCGPHTTREIIEWAQGCGVTIKPSLPRARSLSEMWAGLVASSSAGALTSDEIVGALQRSIRRKSMRIPVEFQIILVKILLSGFE